MDYTKIQQKNSQAYKHDDLKNCEDDLGSSKPFKHVVRLTRELVCHQWLKLVNRYGGTVVCQNPGFRFENVKPVFWVVFFSHMPL